MESIKIAIIQGVTEFLPVSSSGHMFLYQFFTGIESDFRLEIWFHFASVVALILYFHKSIAGYLMEGFMDLFRPHKWADNESYLLLFWSLTTCVGIALLLSFIDLPEVLTVHSVGVTLCITAGLIFLSAFWPYFRKDRLTWPLALLLGVAQVFAIFPGMSRSGVVLAVLILLGFNRVKAFELAMISGIPIILAATVYGLKEMDLKSLWSFELWLAFLVCVFASLMGIVFLRSVVRRYWTFFGAYCLMLGTFLLFTYGL